MPAFGIRYRWCVKSGRIIPYFGGKPDKPKFCRFCNSNDFIGDFITHHGPQLGESKYKGYIEAPERLYITFF